jgi:hypothetical protein
MVITLMRTEIEKLATMAGELRVIKASVEKFGERIECKVLSRTCLFKLEIRRLSME